MVVPEVFLPAIDPLVTLRASQGHNVVVAPFESVAVRINSYQTYGDVSAKLTVIEPLATPVNV